MLEAITLPQLFVISGLFFIMAELFVGIDTGFDLILIGSILIISGFIGLFTGNISLMLGLAALLAILYIAVGRKQIKARVTVLTHKTNIDSLPGKTGMVIRSITPDTAGMVRLNDEDWRASADQVIHEKEKIKVVSIEGVTLNVKKA
jgi:membrane protein implicated in regulation of membrane protease activity